MEFGMETNICMLKKQNNSLSHTYYEILKLKSLNSCAKNKAFIKVESLRVGAWWLADKNSWPRRACFLGATEEKKKIIN